MPQHFAGRARLGLNQSWTGDAQIFWVSAPGGYGKTCVLLQWRRDSLFDGQMVVWLSIPDAMNAQSFVRALGLALAEASGRPEVVAELGEQPVMLAMTAWLHRVAQLGRETLVMLDDVHQLPDDVVGGPLSYLVNNLPANVRLVLAARPHHGRALTELLSSQSCVRIGVPQLKFTLAEARELLRARYARRLDDDTCARLHNISEGWSLGLVLAASAVDVDPEAFRAVLSGKLLGHRLEQYFVRSLIHAISPADGDFLAQISVVDQINTDLAVFITQRDDAAQRLLALSVATPVLSSMSYDGWLRMHELARTFLLQRLAPSLRRKLHERAALWLAGHELHTQAIQQAREAQREDLLQLYNVESLLEYARLGDVGAILAMGDAPLLQCFSQDERLGLNVVLVLACTFAANRVLPWIEPIHARHNADTCVRREADICLAVAWAALDRLDESARCLQQLPSSCDADTEPISATMQLASRLCQAHIQMNAGHPEAARMISLRECVPPGMPQRNSMHRIGDHLFAQACLWEARLDEAQRYLRDALAECEVKLGRRSVHATGLACALARALWEQGFEHDEPEVAALLADRIDIMELTGPATVIEGLVTAAHLAFRLGEGKRALALLNRLAELGRQRCMPRLLATARRHLMRVHARLGHEGACEVLAAWPDSSWSEQPSAVPEGLVARLVHLQNLFAQAILELTRQRWRAVQTLAQQADRLAHHLHLTADIVEAKLLLSLSLRCLGEDERAVLEEAHSIAKMHGLRRILNDSWLAFSSAAQRKQGQQTQHADSDTGVRRTASCVVADSGLLTRKERDMLLLLSRGLSNKEIALAVDCSEQTVKWHLKNVFTKFNASTRRQVVDRARVLGMLRSN